MGNVTKEKKVIFQKPVLNLNCVHIHTVKPALKGHLWDKEKLVSLTVKDRLSLKEVQFYDMKFSMMGQEKCDLLIQVTT